MYFDSKSWKKAGMSTGYKNPDGLGSSFDSGSLSPQRQNWTSCKMRIATEWVIPISPLGALGCAVIEFLFKVFLNT